MSKHYPDQKPAFLFDEIEQKTHAAINADSFRALQADRDAARMAYEQEHAARIQAEGTLEGFEEWANERLSEIEYLQNQLEEVRTERNALQKTLASEAPPLDDRAETTYLNIIGALLALLVEASPTGRPPSYGNQEAVIQTLLERYPNVSGLGDRTLRGRFSRAKQSLRSLS